MNHPVKSFLLAAAVSLAPAFTIHGEQTQPNIVWLVTEDNSADWLRLYNPEQGAPMPTVERLAAGGLVFNNAFSCAPVCSTARSTIISGCYGPRLGSHYHRKQQTVPMPEGLKMFPYYLRKAGYYTTNPGKMDYNFHKEEIADAWDGTSRKFSYKNRAPGQPFFHVKNFATTHESRMHFKGINDSTTTAPDSIEVFPYHPDTETFRYSYARYLDLHRKVDAEMGTLVAELEAEGLMDDTIIFYYGDHGGVLPRGKGYIYESGLQVPLVVYIPEKWQHLSPAPAGSRIDGFVEFVDLAATVLNLAGAEIPAEIDGTPFLGKGVTLDELNERDEAFGYADRFDEKYDFVRTLRKGRFKYMRNFQPFNFDGLQSNYRYKMLAYQEWRELFKAGELNAAQSQFFLPRSPEALYDLENDPNEVVNLADDPAYTNTLLDLRRRLNERLRSMPDLSFFPEPMLLSEGGENPTAFGKANKERIDELLRIANLSLQAFPEAKSSIQAALNSEDPMQRYWGLITCSNFGEQAEPFYQQAEQIATDSKQLPLVRTRAAEFLGLTGAADPRSALTEILLEVSNPIEANLILNSVTLLRDSKGLEFDLSQLKSAEWATGKRNYTHWRIGYLKGLE
jgi:arylsulfatase A-like enzyme